MNDSEIIDSLGSPMSSIDLQLPFQIGKAYNRKRDIHGVYGGQPQGGISTPSDGPFYFLFTGPSGSQYGYNDGWDNDGTFRYTGEGQVGQMVFKRGNAAIRDHQQRGRDLLIFERLKNGSYRFLGVFACAGYELGEGEDSNGDKREVIVFQLVPVAVGSTETVGVVDRTEPQTTLDELRRRAMTASNPSVSNGKTAKRSYYARSADVRNYVLARAQGTCEACMEPAPFKRRDGTPYLEPHHTLRLSDGGPDDPRHVGAVCPTCHRRIHSGVDGRELNERLIKRLQELEL